MGIWKIKTIKAYNIETYVYTHIVLENESDREAERDRDRERERERERENFQKRSIFSKMNGEKDSGTTRFLPFCYLFFR